MDPAAVGFRTKPGRATAILLTGSATAPRMVDRQTIQLANPETPESSSPYHAALALPPAEGSRTVARLVEVARAATAAALADLLEAYVARGYRPLGIGVVGGSEVDPRRIGNDQVRAHAEEGRLFPWLLEEAGRAEGLPVLAAPAKLLLARASETLGRPEGALKEALTALGQEVGPPCTQVEKSAALAAWLVLHGVGPDEGF